MRRRGKTLWEMLVEKFWPPVEMQFYNPLKAFLALCCASVLAGLLIGGLLCFFHPSTGLNFLGFGILAAIVIGSVGFLAEALRLQAKETPARRE